MRRFCRAVWWDRPLRGLSDGVYQRVQELVPELAAAVAAPAELPLLRLTGRLEKDREALPGVLTGLTLVFRDALVLRSGGDGCLSIAPDAAAALSQALSRERLLRLLETAGELERIRRRNANHTLLLTLLTAACGKRPDGEGWISIRKPPVSVYSIR